MHASLPPLPSALLDPAVAAALHAARSRSPGGRPVAVEECGRHTNPRVEVRYEDGRPLVVKRGDEEWRRQRFAASRAACGLLLRRTGILAPDPLSLAGAPAHPPMEAYLKIEAPTLAETWPGLDGPARARALRGWGALLRRVNRVRPRGHGALPAAERTAGALEDHLIADLGQRLLPAVRQSWPQASGLVESLAESVPAVAARAGDPVLLHGDPHQANVLCERRPRGVRCVGVIDLEGAWAGPPEADVATAELVHGSLFAPLPRGWTAEFRRGYDEPLDPAALAFYRGMLLANLGYHAALTGLHAHAAQVLAATRAAASTLRGLLRSRPAQAR